MFALSLAAFAGAAAWALAATAVVWLVAWRTRGILRVLLLLAAPLLISAGTPASVGSPTALMLAAVVAVAALVPLAREMGPTRMPRRAAATAGLALLLSALLLVTPWSRILLASDLAPGAVVVALAAGLLASAPFATQRAA